MVSRCDIQPDNRLLYTCSRPANYACRLPTLDRIDETAGADSREEGPRYVALGSSRPLTS